MEDITGDRDLKRRVMRLESLISYESGSVVSRTIVDKETGTVTLFAFDEGEGLSEHTAPFDALIYILEGEGEVSLSGELFRLVEGEMIIMPSREPHALRAKKRMKMLLVMIKE